MNVVIDIGNTRSKLAVFDNGVQKQEKVLSEITETTIEQIFRDFDAVENALVSSVSGEEERIGNYLSGKNINTLILNDSVPLPFINNYETKETLGKDRLAAIAGACFLYPKKNVLVIDAGTAITFDIKSSDEQYLGGNISPGLTMRFKALHQFTARLPLLQPDEKYSLLGKNTNEAIIAGIQQGIIFEMNGYIDQLEKQYPDLVVILSGGDVLFFDKKLKRTIFVVPNLTLIGLNSILNYNLRIK